MPQYSKEPKVELQSILKRFKRIEKKYATEIKNNSRDRSGVSIFRLKTGLSIMESYRMLVEREIKQGLWD